MRALRARGRGRCDVRAGGHQHGHRNCHGDARFLAHRLHYRASGKQAHRLGRVSGGGHHGRHAAHHQAQLSGHARRPSRTDDQRSFYVASSGRPGPVLVDITKDAQQSTCDFDGKPVTPQLPGYRPDLSPTPDEYKQALELIHSFQAPGDSGWARHHFVRRDGRSARVRREAPTFRWASRCSASAGSRRLIR
jgi:hypothetical protein